MRNNVNFDRDAAAARVVKTLVRNNMLDFLAAGNDGARNLVVAHEHDTIADTTARVVAVGGHATVLVYFDSQHVTTLTCSGIKGDLDSLGAVPDVDDDVHEIADIVTMGQFAEYLSVRDTDTVVNLRRTTSSLISGHRAAKQLALT